MPIKVNGSYALLFATIRRLLSDGDGLRIALQWMGQGALKPCWRHWNVMKKDSDRAHRVEGYVEITESNPEAFERWGDDAFHVAIDVILAARARRATGERGWVGRHQEIEQAFGFSPTAEGLLADAELRLLAPVQRVMRYDWPHTLLADGVVTNAAWAFIRACSAQGVATQEELYAFLQLKLSLIHI